MVLKDMLAASAKAVPIPHTLVAASDNPSVKTVTRKPCILKIEFAGISIDVTVIFTNNRYVARRDLARILLVDMLPMMLIAAGYDIENERQIPTHEMTGQEERVAFTDELVMYDAAQPGT
jgi:hypothetical protein